MVIFSPSRNVCLCLSKAEDVNTGNPQMIHNNDPLLTFLPHLNWTQVGALSLSSSGLNNLLPLFYPLCTFPSLLLCCHSFPSSFVWCILVNPIWGLVLKRAGNKIIQYDEDNSNCFSSFIFYSLPQTGEGTSEGGREGERSCIEWILWTICHHLRIPAHRPWISLSSHIPATNWLKGCTFIITWL